MSAKHVGAAILGLVLGLLIGGGGLYYAQTRGLIERWNSSAEHDEHHGHDEVGQLHDEHDDDDDEADHSEERGAVRLTPEATIETGIEIAEAGGGQLERTISLPGEIVLNADNLAHIVPRVSGIVREVRKTIGDAVQPGEVLAVLESRELAEAKAAYIAGTQRLSLAQANLAANEELQATGVVPQLDFLTARKELAEAEIELRAAEYQLHALGVSNASLPSIEQRHDEAFATYTLRAPFGGTIIEKHITLGEVVTPESDVFVLADLSDVWVNLTVYQKDLPLVRVGQPVTVVAGEGIGESSASIDYVSPVVKEATRTAVARLTLSNPDGKWRPGLFVTGTLQVETVTVGVLVPKEAIQTLEGRTVVFVVTDDGFEPRPATIGRTDGTRVEITAGLMPGERYVRANAFTLKSELGKAEFEEGHGH